MCKGTPADLIAEECLPEWSDWNYDKNNNTISIDNTGNMGTSTTCGSGKKYKQCCGK